MGSLIIKKVLYEGDKYSYESPELSEGINIIIGDNGSGKSTFTYFIEYCLGGYLKYFNEENDEDKYYEIINDSNNYVQIFINIDSQEYILKRFIEGNVIHINHGKEFFSLPIYRQQSDRHSDNEIFSDWLLDKLSITNHEINLGTRTWRLNINDLLRLIIYDQETSSKKIFKEPSNLNFVTDSLIIRKTIFEVLLGISSEKYFRKYEDLKQVSISREKEQLKLNNFEEKYSGIELNKLKVQQNLDKLNSKLEQLHIERDLFLNTNKKVDEKTNVISSLQENIINNEIKLSEISVRLESNHIEYDKILSYYQSQSNEINEVEKIIFTNDKLNLFSFKVCPFCLTKHTPKENHCLCGAEIIDEDYEKFRYTSKEYESILKHKKKSLETIQLALDSYAKEIGELRSKKENVNSEIKQETDKLKALISSTEVNSNSKAINLLHDEILSQLKQIESEEYKLKIAQEKDELLKNYSLIDENYKKIKSEFDQLHKKFEKENQKIIKDFNNIYETLLLDSSAEITAAEINEDYMPVIDNGIYKNKSAGVPIRLMYYFTIIALAIKYENVKHPKLLIIDTPEDSGIDEDNLKKDLMLLDDALKNAKQVSYQIILTTGLEKYPDNYGKYIVERFNKKEENKFILKEK